MKRRVLLFLGLAFGMLAPFVAPAVAAPDAGSVSLALTPSAVTYGDHQQGSGAVQADSPCAAGRTVDLQQRPVGTTSWTDLASTTSGDDGGFSFSFTPETNAFYRAVAEPGLLGGVTCGEIDSASVRGRVIADVGLSLGRNPVLAGECVKVTVSVRPAKPGQQARLQRLGGDGWQTLEPLTLDSSSRAGTSLCYEWASIGAIRLRAFWPKQDPANAEGTSPAIRLVVAKAPWMKHIDQLAGPRPMGIAVRAGGHFLYERRDDTAFTPASNEKLMLSMALLDAFDPQLTMPTTAAARKVQHGVVRGDLWILGRGDPSVGKATIRRLAQAIAGAGIRKITGSVMGSTGYFAHDWFAPGWKRDFPAEDVALPSALTFRGNQVHGRHVANPELYAAMALTRHLHGAGVSVRGRAGSGAPRGGLSTIASVQSPPLVALLRHMDHDSDNFYAEVLGKRLGVAVAGVPGTIARGAAAIASWTRAHGVPVATYDGSGLSYANRVAPAGLALLLEQAEQEPWGTTLRSVLARPGEGTLEDRLSGVKVRAKTGTLDNISALSGWVWLSRLKTWAEFSILSRGVSTSWAKDTEDAIVRTLAGAAH